MSTKAVNVNVANVPEPPIEQLTYVSFPTKMQYVDEEKPPGL